MTQCGASLLQNGPVALLLRLQNSKHVGCPRCRVYTWVLGLTSANHKKMSPYFFASSALHFCSSVRSSMLGMTGFLRARQHIRLDRAHFLLIQHILKRRHAPRLSRASEYNVCELTVYFCAGISQVGKRTRHRVNSMARHALL